MALLSKKLLADDPAMRWAAVRAMAQIGGEEAGPAVDFLLRELAVANDRDGYNCVVYLGLIGPPARRAGAVVDRAAGDDHVEPRLLGRRGRR